jgi:hypothetical protein
MLSCRSCFRSKLAVICTASSFVSISRKLALFTRQKLSNLEHMHFASARVFVRYKEQSVYQKVVYICARTNLKGVLDIPLQTRPIDTLVPEEHTQIESHNLRVDRTRRRRGKLHVRAHPDKHALLRAPLCHTHQLCTLGDRAILLCVSCRVPIDICLGERA